MAGGRWQQDQLSKAKDDYQGAGMFFTFICVYTGDSYKLLGVLCSM